MSNIAYLVQNLQASPAAPALDVPPGGYVQSRNNGSAVDYLDTKLALFPEEKLLDRKAPKPKKRDLPTRDADADAAQDDPGSSDVEATSRSDRSSPPIYGISLNDGRARKRARLQTEKSRVNDALKWTQAISRLVKGKARLTPELLSEVSTTLTDVENKNNEIVQHPDVLQTGLFDTMKLLAEAQDNVYSLEGLRERAKHLVDSWKWILTR